MRFTREGVGGMTEQLVGFLVIMVALAAVLPALLSAEAARREAREYSLMQDEARSLARLIADAPQLRGDTEAGLALALLSNESLRRTVEAYAPSHAGKVQVASLAQNGTAMAAWTWGEPYRTGPVAGGSFPVLLTAVGGEGLPGLVAVALWGF